MTLVYLGLGSNLGDKAAHLRDAFVQLANLGTILKTSRVYETEPVGDTNQDWFLNCAVALETVLEPDKLLAAIKTIERRLGRTRTRRNGPRVIDIDILFYDDRVVNTSRLVIPHPRLQDRLFVLQPLMDLDPTFVHPVLTKTIQDLYQGRTWTDKVVPCERPV